MTQRVTQSLGPRTQGPRAPKSQGRTEKKIREKRSNKKREKRKRKKKTSLFLTCPRASPGVSEKSPKTSERSDFRRFAVDRPKMFFCEPENPLGFYDYLPEKFFSRKKRTRKPFALFFRKKMEVGGRLDVILSLPPQKKTRRDPRSVRF